MSSGWAGFCTRNAAGMSASDTIAPVTKAKRTPIASSSGVARFGSAAPVAIVPIVRNVMNSAAPAAPGQPREPQPQQQPSSVPSPVRSLLQMFNLQ